MRYRATLTRATIVILAYLSSGGAKSADFTFEVPIEVTNFGPGAEAVSLRIQCQVTMAVAADGMPLTNEANIVARHTVLEPLGPGPATASRIVTLEMNAENPRLRPASAARAYSCWTQANLTFPDGEVSLPPAESYALPFYETATGHTLTRFVPEVWGLIPR